MSSKENRENLPADSADETAAIEEKINAAMDRLTEDYPETSPEEENREYADYEDASVPEEEDEEGAYSGEEPDDIEYAEDEPDDMEEEEEPDENEESPPISERSRNKSARPNPVVYVPMDDLDEEMPLSSQKKKKHKGLKITGLLLIMLIVIAGCAYAGVSYYYADRFFEGTWINGINCSGKTAYETEMLLADQIQNYSIEVLARNQEPQTITGSQINYQYLSSGEVLKLLKQQKPYEWIKGFYEKTNYTVSENTSYDKTLLQNQVISLNCAKAENQVEPENAYVAFKDNQFQIVPETEGSKLNIKQAYQILDKAISETQTSVDFNTAPDAYVSAEITQNDPELQSALEACNNYTKASITYTFGDQTVTLDGNTIKDWLQFDEKGQLLLDDASFQQHIADYVAQVAAQYDTVGTEREFHTTSGRVVYVSGSAYGWAIDQSAEVAQLSQEIQSGAQVTRQPAYSQTANSYGVNDLGDTYIEVDLSEQHMYYYQSGSLIFDSDFVSGNMSYSDRQTPSGIYTLYYKKSPDVLRGAQKPDGTYEYEEPVEYWMPFKRRDRIS